MTNEQRRKARYEAACRELEDAKGWLSAAMAENAKPQVIARFRRDLHAAEMRAYRLLKGHLLPKILEQKVRACGS